MGNQCCKGHQSVTTRQKALAPEPPLRKDTTIYDATQSELAAQVNAFTIQLSETLRQGKQLSDHVTNCKKKTTALVARAEVNVKKYQGKSEGAKSEAVFPEETVQFFIECKSEIEEMIQILSNLRKNTVLRYQEPVALFTEKLAKLEDDKAESRDAIARRLASPTLSKEDGVQAAELKLALATVSPSLEQAETHLKAIEENHSEVEDQLARVPDLLAQLKAYQQLIPESSDHVELIVEEANSQPIDEFQMEAELDFVAEERFEEVSLAAEAPQQLVAFEEVYDEQTEYSDFLTENAVSKVYSKHKNELLPAVGEESVYHTFGQILIKKQEQEGLALDLFIVQYFLTEFSEAPFNSLVQFVEGVRTMLGSGAAYAHLIANFIGVFDPKPYSRIVVDLLTELGKKLDVMISDTDKKKRAELGRELTESELHEKLVSGGKVSLSSVLTLAYPLFEEYPKYGQELLELLKPSLVETVEYLNFLLVHRMKDRSLDGISFFKYMATNDTVSFSAFTTGIQTILKLWISQEAIETLFYAIRNPDKEDMHRVELVKSLRLQKFVDQQKSDSFQLPKYQVLAAFAEVFQKRRTELIPELFSKYQKRATSVDSLNVEQLENVFKDLGAENVVGVLKETEKKPSTFRDLVRLVEAYGVKSYADSFFCKAYRSTDLGKKMHRSPRRSHPGYSGLTNPFLIDGIRSSELIRSARIPLSLFIVSLSFGFLWSSGTRLFPFLLRDPAHDFVDLQ